MQQPAKVLAGRTGHLPLKFTQKLAVQFGFFPSLESFLSPIALLSLVPERSSYLFTSALSKKHLFVKMIETFIHQ
ncbi:hypothetical protein [Microcoleus sp. B9-D4]|uniref:hypothetical protein n=1 Tax=Microcoleus sp. B9-D4 TaxID=2818711 RepID=UPI002FCF965C